MKGLLASLFGAIIMSCSGCGGGDSSSAPAASAAPQAEQPASPPAIIKASLTPEADYRAIAQATLPVGSTSAQIDARETLVEQFIASNGGDTIYENYLAAYGAPTDTRKEYFVSTDDVSSAQLGYYYLSHPLSSADDTIWFDCVNTASNLPNSPTQQALCALSQWDAYMLTGQATYAQSLVTFADGFLSASVNGQLQWTNETIPAFGITTTPWISALTQSVATSVLLRAYQYTGQQKYMTAATAAYQWLTKYVADGGTQTNTIGTWLEEYPNQTPGAESGHVLNGDIWALFGVRDYYRVTGDANAAALIAANLQAIKVNMSWYDLDYWSVYSHLNRTDTLNGLYMQFVVQQMYVLGYISGDSYFTSLAGKWQTDQATDALFVQNMATAYLQAYPN